MDILIFVTVGTSDFQFNRLLRIIDELCDEKILNPDNIFAQIGCSTYKPKNYKYIDTVTNEEHKEYIKRAKFIITHSGTGSIISALRDGKKVIAFPRFKKHNEHVDDHQLELAKAFINKGYILSAINKCELINAIRRIDNFNPNKYISNNKNMITIIDKYIESLK